MGNPITPPAGLTLDTGTNTSPVTLPASTPEVSPPAGLILDSAPVDVPTPPAGLKLDPSSVVTSTQLHQPHGAGGSWGAPSEGASVFTKPLISGEQLGAMMPSFQSEFLGSKPEEKFHANNVNEEIAHWEKARDIATNGGNAELARRYDLFASNLRGLRDTVAGFSSPLSVATIGSAGFLKALNAPKALQAIAGFLPSTWFTGEGAYQIFSPRSKTEDYPTYLQRVLGGLSQVALGTAGMASTAPATKEVAMQAVGASREAVARTAGAVAEHEESRLAQRQAQKDAVNASKIDAKVAVERAHDLGVLSDERYNGIKKANPQQQAALLQREIKGPQVSGVGNTEVLTNSTEDGRAFLTKATSAGLTSVEREDPSLMKILEHQSPHIGEALVKNLTSDTLDMLHQNGHDELAKTAVETAENHIQREADKAPTPEKHLLALKTGYDELSRNGILDVAEQFEPKAVEGAAKLPGIAERANAVNDLIKLRESVENLQIKLPKTDVVKTILNTIGAPNLKSAAFNVLGAVLGYEGLGIGGSGLYMAGRWLLNRDPAIRTVARAARAIERAALPGIEVPPGAAPKTELPVPIIETVEPSALAKTGGEAKAFEANGQPAPGTPAKAIGEEVKGIPIKPATQPSPHVPKYGTPLHPKYDENVVLKISNAKPGEVVGTLNDFYRGEKIRSLYGPVLDTPIVALDRPVEKGQVIKPGENVIFYGGSGTYQGKPAIFINPKYTNDIIRTVNEEAAHTLRKSLGRPVGKVDLVNFDEDLYKSLPSEISAKKMADYADAIKENSTTQKQTPPNHVEAHAKAAEATAVDGAKPMVYNGTVEGTAYFTDPERGNTTYTLPEKEVTPENLMMRRDLTPPPEIASAVKAFHEVAAPSHAEGEAPKAKTEAAAPLKEAEPYSTQMPPSKISAGTPEADNYIKQFKESHPEAVAPKAKGVAPMTDEEILATQRANKGTMDFRGKFDSEAEAQKKIDTSGEKYKGWKPFQIKYGDRAGEWRIARPTITNENLNSYSISKNSVIFAHEILHRTMGDITNTPMKGGIEFGPTGAQTRLDYDKLTQARANHPEEVSNLLATLAGRAIDPHDPFQGQLLTIAAGHHAEEIAGLTGRNSNMNVLGSDAYRFSKELEAVGIPKELHQKAWDAYAQYAKDLLRHHPNAVSQAIDFFEDPENIGRTKFSEEEVQKLVNDIREKEAIPNKVNEALKTTDLGAQRQKFWDLMRDQPVENESKIAYQRKYGPTGGEAIWLAKQAMKSASPRLAAVKVGRGY